MSIQGKIGFIGGGKMGEALIKGIIDSSLTTADRIMASEPDDSRRTFLIERYGITCHEKSETIWSECSTIILAVKPQVMGEALLSAKGICGDKHLVISIAAGITLDFLENILGSSGCRLIRVMPNTPALVLEAATAMSPGPRATKSDVATTHSLFNAIGATVTLDEHHLDAVTGLSGSGPAYVFSFIEAMTDAGVKVGLSRDIAEKLVLQTMLGSTKLAMESGQHPAQLRAMVTSPGGTTIAGLHVLAASGFTGIIMDAVEEATERSRELGSRPTT